MAGEAALRYPLVMHPVPPFVLFCGLRTWLGFLSAGTCGLSVLMSKVVKSTTQRVNPNVKYGLLLITYQYWLINDNECKVLITGEVGGRVRGTRDLCTFHSFFCKLKLLKKKKS